MERLASAALRDLLARVAPLVDEGAVNVLSVAAIRDASGAKWSRRRPQVEDFIERAFARLVPAGGMVVALNDLEFITVQPGVSKWTALATTAAILKETLSFFLGAVARDDLRLFVVTSVTDGELRVEPVDASRFMDGKDGDEAVGGTPAAAAQPSGASALPLLTQVERSDGRSAPQLLSCAGRDYEVRSQAHSTWNVRDRVVASFLVDTRATPTSPTGGAGEGDGTVSPALAGEIALQSLAFAVQQIEHGRKAGAPAAMHVPLSWSAVSSSPVRLRLLHALRDLEPGMRRLIVAEVVDVAEGLPQGRLAEIVGILAPSCRAVLVRAPSERADLLRWRRSGLNGISLDCSHIDAADRGALSRLSVFARNASALAPASVAYGLRSRSLLLAAWAAGFTHLGGEAVSTGAPEVLPLRLQPSDLYAAGAAR